MATSTAVLFQDETKLRLFPVLRRAWSLSGQQGRIAISGSNAQMVLSCALDIKTGRRVTLQHRHMSAGGFQAFLTKVRNAYGKRHIALLLDNGGLHTAKISQQLARELNITLIWLPKQVPELNCVDHLWRSVKADVSANRQFESIEAHANTAEAYMLALSNKHALTRAGVYANNFWLKKFN